MLGTRSIFQKENLLKRDQWDFFAAAYTHKNPAALLTLQKKLLTSIFSPLALSPLYIRVFQSFQDFIQNLSYSSPSSR